MTRERWYYKKNVDEIFSTLKEVCREISGGIEIDDISRKIRIVTSSSLLSYGENIEVLVNNYKEGVAVTIEANPRLWFNITSNPDRYLKNIRDSLNSVYKGQKID